MIRTLNRLGKISLDTSGSQKFVKCSTKASQSLAHQRNYQNLLTMTYGQPTPSTHPHLMKEGELLPGIKLEEFKDRRSTLMQRILAEMNEQQYSAEKHIIIIPSSSKVYMSDKIPYVFRQNTDFLYFSGCQEPDSILLIIGDNNDFRTTLFVQKKDPHLELWDGPKTGTELAPAMFGVDEALPVSEFERYFLSYTNDYRNSITWYDREEVVQPLLHRKLRQIAKMSGNIKFECPKTIFHKIRMIKSYSEVVLMQKSCDIASAAIQKTIEVSKPNINEHHLFATVDYECRMNGAEFLAYPPVVAGGKNANIIHYITNNQIVHDGDMVLMDAGCEYHGYTSDITRTWPINGSFTPQQQVLYEIVLEVQKILIQRLREMPTLDQAFHDMCLLLGKRLQEINLIPKDYAEDKIKAAAYTYCPHHVSHYLGMDVHDTGKVPRNVKVQPGMVVTVEPGIYVNAKNKLASPEFCGLGIRIEDDVLVQNDGPLVLSNKCPKEIADIETLAKRRC